MADDFIELGAEIVGSGVDHWEQITNVGSTIRRKAPSLRGKSRKNRRNNDDGGHQSEDSHSPRRRDEDWDRFSGYPPYNERGNPHWRGPNSGRPGIRRRTSSLDRGQFNYDRSGRLDVGFHKFDRPFRTESKDRRRRRRRVQEAEEKTREELSEKREDFKSYKKDAAAALTAGVAGVAVVYAAEKLLAAYKTRDQEQESHHKSRRRAASSSSPASSHAPR